MINFLRLTARQPRSTRRRTRRFSVERLEGRELLSAAGPAFVSRDVTNFFQAAREGQNTAPAAFTKTLTALQGQLTSGPLADLSAQRIGGNAFVAAVNSLVASFQASVDRTYLPFAPRLANLLDLQGSAILATEQSINQNRREGLFPKPSVSPNPEYYYLKASTEAIRRLTLSRPLWPVGTPLLAFFNGAGVFAQTLRADVVNNLGSSSPTPLTVTQAQAVADGEAAAFQISFDASLTRHPRVSALVNTAVSQLEADIGAIAPSAPDAQALAASALAGFTSRILTGQGLFGPEGPLHNVFRQPSNPLFESQFSKAITFAGDQAAAVVLKRQRVFFRVFSDPKGAPIEENNFFGSFSSTTQLFNSQTAIRILALDQSYFHPNLATMKLDIIAPAGTTVYIGRVAPIEQGVLAPQSRPAIYPGLGQQTVILSRNTQFVDPRPIDAQG